MRHLVTLGLATLSLMIPSYASAQSGLPESHPAPPALDPLRAEDLDSITIEKTMYFLDPDGRYVITPAGLYLVRAREDLHLVLIPSQGRQVLVVQARVTVHQEPVTDPVALTVADQQSDVHVILLRPGGKGLVAMGAVTPMRLRSVEPPSLTSEQVQQALAKKTAGQVTK